MKVMIAIPCLDTVPTVFMESLCGLIRPSDVTVVTAKNSLVYDAREALGSVAISDGCDRVLWLDSDMTFDRDLFLRLNQDLDTGCRFVSALCFTRKEPIMPVIYSEIGYGDDGNSYADCIFDYPADSLFRVGGVGLSAAMMDVGVLKEVKDKCGDMFLPLKGLGEDLSFCIRCLSIGIPIHCDSRVKVGHIFQTVINEGVYERLREKHTPD